MSSFFDNNPFGEQIFKLRYAYDDNETWEQACRRVSDHVARGEAPDVFARWSDEFYDELVSGRFMPGGRIWYGSGRNKAQLINCFVLPAGDSREGWGKLLHDTTIISGTGGGVGTNFSGVRYRNAPIAGTGGFATGAVSLMRMENGVGEEIKGGGGRRAAYMFCLNHDHPDIMEFLDAKLNTTKLPPRLLQAILDSGIQRSEIPDDLLRGELNNANISVVIMNESAEAFFEKVRADQDHDLVWQGKVVRTIKARELWTLVVENALKNGEPGILNGHYANEMNNLHYYADLESTNPCGEIWMQPYSVCCLGAVVLPRFVKMDSKAKDPLSRIDWGALHDTVSRGVRFLDDVLTVTHYPIPEVEVESKKTRRIGLGIMGLADMFVRLGLRYTSAEAIQVVDRVMAFIKHAAYDTSTYLAVEKGPFPVFNADEFLKSGFVKTLKPSMRAKIKSHGMRNCACITVAPTGTTAIVQGVWGSGEPYLAPAYKRNFMDADRNVASEIVVMPIFEEFVKNGWDTSHFEGADEVHPEKHFEIQVSLQRHVDNSISKTVNIPQGNYTPELLSELYMKYLPQLKGVTIYPEGSRDFTPLERIPNEDGVNYVISNVATTGLEDTCASGVCGL